MVSRLAISMLWRLAIAVRRSENKPEFRRPMREGEAMLHHQREISYPLWGSEFKPRVFGSADARNCRRIDA
jgi:hypothetical protein